MPFVVRFRVPEGDTEWDDAVHGRIAFPNKDIEDFVILRSDGTPIYNLAVVSDDIDMGDHTRHARRRSHLEHAETDPALPRAGHRAAALRARADDSRPGREEAQQAPWRDGRRRLPERGILPSAMVNFLALLGWSPGGDREVMTLDEMIALFSLDGLQKKAAIFDPKKLEWMNGQHLSRISAIELEPRADAGARRRRHHHRRDAWNAARLVSCADRPAEGARAHGTTTSCGRRRPTFRDEIAYDPEAVAKQWKDRAATAELLRAMQERARERCRRGRRSRSRRRLRALAEPRAAWRPASSFSRFALRSPGSTVSPGIFEVLIAMGPELANEATARQRSSF